MSERPPYRKGRAITVAIGYVALMDHLIQPPLPPTLAAQYLNEKTKYLQLLPDFPFNATDVSKYRRRIYERHLEDRRSIAESVELNLPAWLRNDRALYLS